jgi:hypothetical protein
VSGFQPEPDLTREELAELAVVLGQIIFEQERGQQRLARIHGRQRPVEPGLIGEVQPRPPADGPPDLG